MYEMQHVNPPLLPVQQIENQENQECTRSPKAPVHTTKRLQMLDLPLILRFPTGLTGHRPDDSVLVNGLLARLCFFEFLPE